MKEAGFQDVFSMKNPLPTGPWPADKHLVRSLSPSPNLLPDPMPIKCGCADACVERSRGVELPPNHRGSGGVYLLHLHQDSGLQAG
jgi:hypothetical protein